LAIILIVGLLFFKGTQALFFPPDVLGKASVEQITGAIRAKSPNLTPTQIEHFIDALREARGEPSFERAVEEAKKGNTRVAEGIWRQIYENREKEQNKARQEQADAARNLAASAVTNNIAEGLSWYQKATALDPDNMAGWLGLGGAALVGGTLQESDRAFHRYVELARRAGSERETAVGLTGLGDVLVAQGKLDEALKSYRDSLAIRERLAASDRSNTGWQRDLSLSYIRVGDVLVAQGKLDEALKSYRDSLAIAERLAASDRSNTGWQRDLAVSYGRIGNILVAQGKLDEALKSYRDSLAIFERLAASDRSNTGWQNDVQYSIGRIGSLAYRFIFARNFASALEASDLVISLAPDMIWLRTNRAHALMFLDRVDEARALYLRQRGEKNLRDGKPRETVILEDFAELRKAGLTHPLMDEIKERFAAGG
jgi:tetratricopeptide (TPR) repeat protein